jgi:hypothetical protein
MPTMGLARTAGSGGGEEATAGVDAGGIGLNHLKASLTVTRLERNALIPRLWHELSAWEGG